MSKLILMGAGGHSKVIRDIALVSGHQVYAVVDDALAIVSEKDGVIYAPTDFLLGLKLSDYQYCISIGNNATRKKLFEKLSLPLEQYATLIHPSAIISPSAEICAGTVVMPNAVINADTVIGAHSIINTGAVIEHDNYLGAYVHVSPKAALCGGVTIGEGTHIGAGAVVIPCRSVGSWTTVGAGAIVVKDIEDNITVAGVPAKELK